MGLVGGAIDVGKSAFNTGMKFRNTINNIGAAANAFDQIDRANSQGNKHDYKLNNSGLIPRKTAPQITKYSSEKDEDGIKKGKRKPLTKAQKIAIGTGATLGALALLNIATTGNVLGPLYSIKKGIKDTPNNIFQKAKSGAFGAGASVAANGVDQAFRRTRPEPKDYYDMVRLGYTFKNNNNKSSGSGFDMKNESKNVISKFTQGLSMGAGVLAAHMIGDKILKNKAVKKSYNSQALTNHDIANYHKTGDYYGKEFVDIAKYSANSIKNDIEEYKREENSQKKHYDKY